LLKCEVSPLSNSTYIIHQGEEVHDYSQSAKIRARGVPRVLRREGYKGLLHRGLYTIIFTTRYVKTLSDNVVTQSWTGLQIYEGRDDQLNRQGPMA
jgi:hypothetical protein